MYTTISDLWLVARTGAAPDMGGRLYGSSKIEAAVSQANADLRDGYADWVSVSLDDAINDYALRLAARAIDRYDMLVSAVERFPRAAPARQGRL